MQEKRSSSVVHYRMHHMHLLKRRAGIQNQQGAGIITKHSPHICYLLISKWHRADNDLSFIFCNYVYSVLLLQFHQQMRTGMEWKRVFNFVSLVSGSDRCYQFSPPKRGKGRDIRKHQVREEEDLRWHRVFVQLIDCQCVVYFAWQRRVILNCHL